MRFHVKEAGADAKLPQHGPLGVAYHRRHPISTVPVARITAHATVPGKFPFFMVDENIVAIRHLIANCQFVEVTFSVMILNENQRISSFRNPTKDLRNCD